MFVVAFFLATDFIGLIISRYHQHVIPVCLTSAISSSTHSSIIGFSSDGYPIYGAFGYTNGTNPNSPIKRMISSWVLRNITVRQTFWNGTVLSSSLWGPIVNATFPIGSFLEDYGYVAGYGDLDFFNGRWTKTPDYPNGTYAYFSTTNSTGYPTYPFFVGPYFYGNVPNVQGVQEVRYAYYVYANSTKSSSASIEAIKSFDFDCCNFCIFIKKLRF